MANDAFLAILGLIKTVVDHGAEHGLKVNLSIELGSEPVDETADESEISAISDVTGSHHHATETDTFLGFSSPAGNQYWDDDELHEGKSK